MTAHRSTLPPRHRGSIPDCAADRRGGRRASAAAARGGRLGVMRTGTMAPAFPCPPARDPHAFAHRAIQEVSYLGVHAPARHVTILRHFTDISGAISETSYLRAGRGLSSRLRPPGQRRPYVMAAHDNATSDADHMSTRWSRPSPRRARRIRGRRRLAAPTYRQGFECAASPASGLLSGRAGNVAGLSDPRRAALSSKPLGDTRVTQPIRNSPAKPPRTAVDAHGVLWRIRASQS